MLKPRIKRIRRNIRAKYQRNCIGCNSHHHPRNFCVHDGLFGRVYLCLDCAQKADVDSFVYEEASVNIVFNQEDEEF